MIGKTISHYKITEELGRGGMGVVYKAIDLDLERAVAVKFLPPHLSGDDDARQRFMHEAKSASALDHQHIGTIYEIGRTDDGQTFIVMAYYEGETLRERIDRGGMSAAEAIGIAAQIASGLARAHEKDIVHRDIKPSNIIITGDGEAKIIDFGLAKLAGKTKLTREGSTLGTAAYMSPEQARGEEVDHRSDIFSLGSILYEMLAGEPPFKGEHEAALLYEIVHEEPRPLSDSRSGLPPDLQRIVERALEKDPARRYQSAKEMIADLEGLKGAQDILPRRSQLQIEILRQRRRIIGAAVAAAVVIVAAVLGIRHFTGGSQVIDSVAVLPFESVSSGATDDYMVEGIMGDLISSLSKIDDLKVTARASAMRFKSTDKTLKEIAAELGVNTVIAGEVRQVGDRIRIYVELIHAATERSLWSENYDRDMRDIEALYNDISLNVIRLAGIELSQDERRRFAKSREVDPRAYEKCLEARHYWHKFTEEGFRKALALFNEAIDIDPLYAQAYAYVALVNCDLMQEPREAAVKARAASQRAFELDDTLAETYTALGWIKYIFDWDFLGAESYLRRAVELKPHDVDIILFLAPYLSVTGRHEEALELYNRAVVLDPLTPTVRRLLANGYYMAGLFDQSIAQHKKAIDMDPTSYVLYEGLAEAYADKGMHAEALAVCDSALILAGNAPTSWLLGLCGYVYARSGRRDKALVLLDKLMAKSEEDYVHPLAVASIYTALDDKDKAFEWLERSYQERHPMIHVFTRRWISLRSDPRYQDLLRRLGVPADWENLWYDPRNDM